MNKLILGILVACAVIGAISASHCGKHQVHVKCACPVTCKNYQDPPEDCLTTCRSGCDCKRGYVWRGRKCVPKDDCPRVHPVMCPGNTTLREDNRIIKTCDNLQLRPTLPGCYCKKNFVYNRLTGLCILPRDCPKEIICPANEIKDTCISPCQATCKRPNPSKDCRPVRCETSCKCRPPLIRNSEKGICVLPSDCLASRCSDPNEEYRRCGKVCTPTCHKRHRTCGRLPCVPGCFCKRGYIRDHVGGKCVPIELCPPASPVPY